MVNPCCQVVSLRDGTVAMGILSILRAVTCLLVTSPFLFIYITNKELIIDVLENYNIYIEFLYLNSTLVIGLTAFMIGVFLFEIPLYSTLTFFAIMRNRPNCNLWWKTKCWLLGLSLAVGAVAMAFSADRYIILAFLLAALVYDAYLIWVTKAYAQEKNQQN